MLETIFKATGMIITTMSNIVEAVDLANRFIEKQPLRPRLKFFDSILQLRRTVMLRDVLCIKG